MKIRETIARNVQYYRKQANLTQESLGEKCGLHRTYIGNIEQQRINVSVDNVARIANALEIDPAMLFLSTKEKEDDEEECSHTSNSEFKNGDYALCTWTDDGIALEPIEVHDEGLSIHILSSLIAQGNADVVKAYNEALKQIKECD